MAEFRFKLGSFLEDKHTGIVGRCVGRTEQEGICNRYEIKGKDQAGGAADVWVNEDDIIEHP